MSPGWTNNGLVRPEGLEPPAYWFEANRSIQLSYGRTAPSYHPSEQQFGDYSFTMPVETEIKLRLPDGSVSARALLEQHGFREISPRQLESDQAFDLPDGDLRQSDRLLRLRSAGGRWIATYKGPAYEGISGGGGRKNREEIETEVLDGPAFAAMLAGLGYRPSFSYEKFRTIFQAPGDPGIVTLDETPIGDFLELEGPGYWIDQTADRLGFDPAEYITLSYAALYQQYRQKHPTVPRDMKFHAP